MQPSTNNRPLIVAMIIIGIIIIILLISPRGSSMRYSQGYYGMTASSVPFDATYTYQTSTPQVIRSYGHPITVQVAPPTSYTYTTTSYPVTTQEYSYSNQYTYTDGCAPYYNYSETTGMPCR